MVIKVSNLTGLAPLLCLPLSGPIGVLQRTPGSAGYRGPLRCCSRNSPGYKSRASVLFTRTVIKEEPVDVPGQRLVSDRHLLFEPARLRLADLRRQKITYDLKLFMNLFSMAYL